MKMHDGLPEILSPSDDLLPGHVIDRATRLNLLQRSDHLRLRVLASAHPSFAFLRPNRIPKWTDLGGQVTGRIVVSGWNFRKACDPRREDSGLGCPTPFYGNGFGPP